MLINFLESKDIYNSSPFEKTPCWLTTLGDYNHLPEPYKESTLEKFFEYLFNLVFKVEFRQVENENKKLNDTLI
ncbi:MAG: hypothetical protein NC833_06165, partial [Candidatus Omnitrophica bacterium]|nr:hypothetical protein [Candidatus Omnitrophota bacterium]